MGLWSQPATIQIEVTENFAPVIEAGSDIQIKEGESANFFPRILNSDGPMVLYEWDFNGDGVYDWNSTQNGNTNYIYHLEGNYNSNLRVTDIDGNQTVDSLKVDVIGEEEPAENIDFLSFILLIILILLIINTIIQAVNLKRIRNLLSEDKEWEDPKVDLQETNESERFTPPPPISMEPSEEGELETPNHSETQKENGPQLQDDDEFDEDALPPPDD